MGRALSGEAQLWLGQGARLEARWEGDGGARLRRVAPSSLPRAADSASLRSMVTDNKDADVAGEEGGLPAAALAEAYRTHWADLLRFLQRNFGFGPPDPEDVAQQAFLRLGTLSGPIDYIGPFLRRAARNLMIDHYRKALRTAQTNRRFAENENQDSEYSPEDIVATKQDLDALNDAMKALPPKERVALLMHRIDGASFTEISEHLGVSHSGARWLVSRALERIALYLRERA